MFNGQMTSGFRVIEHAFIHGLGKWDFDVYGPFCRLYYNPLPGVIFSGKKNPKLEFSPNKFYLIPQGKRVRCWNEGAQLTQFYLHFFIFERLPILNQEIIEIPADEELLNWVKKYDTIRNDSGAFVTRDLRAMHILSGILLRLPPEYLRPTQSISPAIAKACSIISKNPERRRSNEELAKLTGYPLSSFIRTFTREVGETPQVFCRTKRIEMACELMSTTDSSLDEIATLSGFADRFHMSQVFSRVLGCAPARFRQQLGGGLPKRKHTIRNQKQK